MPRTGPGTNALNCCLRGEQLNAQGCMSRGELKSAYAFCVHGGIQALPTLSHGGSHMNNKSMDHLLPGDGRRGTLSLGHQLWGWVSLQNVDKNRWVPFHEGAHARPRALGILRGKLAHLGSGLCASQFQETLGPPNMWPLLLQGGRRGCRDSASLSCGRPILVPWNALLLGVDSCHLSRGCQSSGAPLPRWGGLP